MDEIFWHGTHPFGGGELHQGLAQVRERPLHQAAALAKVHQEGVPKRLLGQHTSIAQQQQPVLRACQRYIQPPGIPQEPYALSPDTPTETLSVSRAGASLQLQCIPATQSAGHVQRTGAASSQTVASDASPGRLHKGGLGRHHYRGRMQKHRSTYMCHHLTWQEGSQVCTPPMRKHGE